MSFKVKREKLKPKIEEESGIVAIIDLDWPKYTASSAAEKRTIVATHKPSGNKKDFKNRTEFWGRSKKQIGGWLGEVNKEREAAGKPPFLKDDFEIEDVVTAENADGAILSARRMVLGVLEELKTTNYKAFLGDGDSFRLFQSTAKKYKGNRDDKVKPKLLGDVTDALIRLFKPEVVQGIEADDAVVIEALKTPNAVVVGVDKDNYSQPIKFFNANRPEEGIVDCDCFGKLYLDGKGSKEKIRGYGRIHLYWQILSEDSIDFYKFNHFSDIPWAAKSAYNALVDCKDDKEALEKMIEVAKVIYPEPKIVEGWRGNEMRVDWLYMLRECFQMARMKTWAYDHTTLDDYFVKYNVEYTMKTEKEIENE